LNLTRREDVDCRHDNPLSHEVEMKSLKIGEIAQRAGVSVRTLRYYEEIGLLMPTDRTDSGHRLYGRDAIERLQQIRSLQQLGLSLSEVDALLRGSEVSPQRIVADHLAQVQAQRDALAQLENQLRRLARLLGQRPRDETQSVEIFLSTLEAMTMYEKHLTPDQIQDVEARHSAAGEEALREWDASVAGLRAEMNAGTSPEDPKVAALVKRWHQAGAAFMPTDDEAAHTGILKVLHEDPQALEDHGLDPELFAYMGHALAPAEHSET